MSNRTSVLKAKCSFFCMFTSVYKRWHTFFFFRSTLKETKMLYENWMKKKSQFTQNINLNQIFTVEIETIQRNLLFQSYPKEVINLSKF